MKKMDPGRRYDCLFVVLLFVLLCNYIYYGANKKGYFIDEVYSYGLANSEYEPFVHFEKVDYSVREWMNEYGSGNSLAALLCNLVKDVRILKECGWKFSESVIAKDYNLAKQYNWTRNTKWQPGQVFKDYLAVTKNSRFNYASVYYNQRSDVHPPLYYMFLHTVCSFAPGVFSKWFGLGLNIVFVLAAVSILYLLVRNHLADSRCAFWTAACFGLCSGTDSMVVFLRMYALLTLIVLAFTYLHMSVIANDWKLEKRNRRLLVLVTVAGYMTQYCFLFYAAAAAVLFEVCALIRHKKKEALQYLITLFIAAIIGIILWPFSVKHIFGGYRGIEAMEGLTEKGIRETLSNVRVLGSYLLANVIGGKNILFYLSGLCFAAGFLIWIVRKDRENRILPGIFLILPSLVYVILTAQIIPFLTERYIMCIYPCICCIVVLGPVFLVKSLRADKRIGAGLAVLTAMAALVFGNGISRGVMYMYSADGQETIEIAENTDCIYVIPDEVMYVFVSDIPILAKCREVAVTYYGNLSDLTGSYTKADGSLIVAVFKEYPEEERKKILEDVIEVLGLENWVRVSEGEWQECTTTLFQPEQ